MQDLPRNRENNEEGKVKTGKKRRAIAGKGEEGRGGQKGSVMHGYNWIQVTQPLFHAKINEAQQNHH